MEKKTVRRGGGKRKGIGTRERAMTIKGPLFSKISHIESK